MVWLPSTSVGLPNQLFPCQISPFALGVLKMFNAVQYKISWPGVPVEECRGLRSNTEVCIRERKEVIGNDKRRIRERYNKLLSHLNLLLFFKLYSDILFFLSPVLYFTAFLLRLISPMFAHWTKYFPAVTVVTGPYKVELRIVSERDEREKRRGTGNAQNNILYVPKPLENTPWLL